MLMTRLVLLLLLTGAAFGQDYIKVKLAINAPHGWRDSVTQNLTVKLNAVPDILVVDSDDTDSAFTVFVDVNYVTNQEEEILGYSLMALLLGTYDQKFLNAAFTEAEKLTSRSDQHWLEILKYSVSGNVYLAGWVHTHGPIEGLSEAYDEIVGKLKTVGLPEYRRFLAMVLKAAAQSTGKGAPVRGRRY